MHINPDHFLATPDGHVWFTPERNAWAWEQCFAALPNALAKIQGKGSLYVMIGAQGSGKSTWAKAKKKEEPCCVIFDAILVKRSERAPILLQAHTLQIPAIAVWFRVPVEVCLARNAMRPPDQFVNETGLRNVHAAIEPPTESEGFSGVIVIDHHTAS